MVSQLCKGHVLKDIDQRSHSPNVSQLLGFRQQQSLRSYQNSCDVFSIPTEPTYSRRIFFFKLYVGTYLAACARSDPALCCDADWCSFVTQTLRLLLHYRVWA